MNNNPIGFLDSGMGGLTVLKTAQKILPNENFIYYADTANMPYGNRTEEEIYTLTYRGVMYLLGRGVKTVVLACNTATNVGIVRLREELNIDIIGMEPAIKTAYNSSRAGKTLIITTLATYSQAKFKALLNRYSDENSIICPSENLAQEIENKFFDRNKLKEIIEKEYGRFKGQVTKIVLGCTHFVLAKDLFQAVFPEAELFDGNYGTVQNLKNRLSNSKNNTEQTDKGNYEIVTSCGDKDKVKLYNKILKIYRLNCG